jgi:hypothetical protein
MKKRKTQPTTPKNAFKSRPRMGKLLEHYPQCYSRINKVMNKKFKVIKEKRLITTPCYQGNNSSCV